MVAGTQRLFVKILALGSYVLFEGDLVVGEEHEVIDEDLCGLLQGILGRDGPVGGDLKYQGLIVGLLLYAAVFPAIVDILDGSVDRVNCNGAYRSLLVFVFVCGNITAALANGEFHNDFHAGLHCADVQVGVEHREIGKTLCQVRSSEFLLTTNSHSSSFALFSLDHSLQTNLLEVEDDVHHVLYHAGDCVKLVLDTLDADGSNGKTLQRREQNAAKRVTNGGRITGLQRAELKAAEGIGSVQHYHLVRFLEC